MSRPLSAPPFPQSPETWLAYFRHRAELTPEKHYSPEMIGNYLGVSGATVRRWEKGTAAPTDNDLVRFASICGLSHHHLAFLQAAFSNRRLPLPPDQGSFESNATALLTRKGTPALLMDEFMYVRAWNSYMPALGMQIEGLLDKERHPLECFLDKTEAEHPNCTSLPAKARNGVRSFWRFSAQYSAAPEYCSLVDRLNAYRQFRPLWASLAESDDLTPIDIFGMADLFLPCQGAEFSVTHSASVFPPLYSLFEFQPLNDQAESQLEAAKARGGPEVVYANRSHWTSRR